MGNKKNRKHELFLIIFGLIFILIAAFLFFGGTNSIGVLAIIAPICIVIGSILFFLDINLVGLR